VTPEGIRYRSRTFPALASMIRWFKEHFRDPIPGQCFCLKLSLFAATVCRNVSIIISLSKVKKRENWISYVAQFMRIERRVIDNAWF